MRMNCPVIIRFYFLMPSPLKSKSSNQQSSQECESSPGRTFGLAQCKTVELLFQAVYTTSIMPSNIQVFPGSIFCFFYRFRSTEIINRFYENLGGISLLL